MLVLPGLLCPGINIRCILSTTADEVRPYCRPCPRVPRDQVNEIGHEMGSDRMTKGERNLLRSTTVGSDSRSGPFPYPVQSGTKVSTVSSRVCTGTLVG